MTWEKLFSPMPGRFAQDYGHLDREHHLEKLERRIRFLYGIGGHDFRRTVNVHLQGCGFPARGENLDADLPKMIALIAEQRPGELQLLRTACQFFDNLFMSSLDLAGLFIPSVGILDAIAAGVALDSAKVYDDASYAVDAAIRAISIPLETVLGAGCAIILISRTGRRLAKLITTIEVAVVRFGGGMSATVRGHYLQLAVSLRRAADGLAGSLKRQDGDHVVVYRAHQSPLKPMESMMSVSARQGRRTDPNDYPMTEAFTYPAEANTPAKRAVFDHRYGGNRYAGVQAHDGTQITPGSPYIPVTRDLHYVRPASGDRPYGAYVYRVQIPRRAWDEYGIPDVRGLLARDGIYDPAPSGMLISTEADESLFGKAIPSEWITLIDKPDR